MFGWVFSLIQSTLHVIGRTVNNQAGIFNGNKNKFNKMPFWTSSFDFFVQLGELIQLNMTCSMKPKQTTQTCDLSSTVSEVRSVHVERHGHRSGRSARPGVPEHRVDRSRRLRKNQGRRKPCFSYPFVSQTTRAPTR